ncbi:tail fibers protein [Escherichia phage vB_EcoP_EcoN5]|uniref:Tail fibers protein n=1 Tax=Escherichia phage vB_EcoP_EcoN5 TaxID=2686238 RepID=A0A7L4XWU9_9CAUD|nr:tail fiber protein [Escherichia phage vB_EcoP_EcoN5]QGZ13715.1 tail fibers protein [Escherichia phage vB_EcoP_EcoN5]
MIVYNNQAPDAVNNVGQFGATEGSIGAYKQAAEYAADSKYWALLAESKFGTIDDLIAEVERLYQQGVLMKQDIEDLKQDFKDQDARLMTLIAQTNAAVSDANNAVALINQKLIEVQNQLDVLLGMSVDVTTLPPGTPATGSFNPNTGVISLGIPEGDPGKDGSVKDLDTAPTGVPELGDLGFYVDKDDNTVHKTTLENIANLIPSVRSVSVNGGPALDGEVALTINKETVGLGNVINVPQYSRQEINDKFDKTTKTYQSKAEADADAQYRQVGEKVLVWEATKYEFYTVAANKTLTPVKTEGRILTVNSRSPDSSGNIDITIPTGNPSLYLGEMVMFPYDPAKNISYPGVLPADGRLVSKESAIDLGPSLVSGQLPVVSETEWQAGARQYFSWGKLADGVTDADSTNFISIRLPDWTGGEAIRSPDSDKDANYKGRVQSQIPYIVTVNGKAPDDANGNVVLTAANVGAAASGANLDITSLNGLTTPLSVAQGGTGVTDIGSLRRAALVQGVLCNDQAGPQSYNSYRSPNGEYAFKVDNSGLVASINARTEEVVPFAIESGGTGATTLNDARISLNLERFLQPSNETIVMAPSKSSYLTISDTSWGAYSSADSAWRALGVGQGGTGATSEAAARVNLKVDKLVQSSTDTKLLDGSGEHTFFITDADWGYFKNSDSSRIALPVMSGGTGGKTPAEGSEKLGAMHCQYGSSTYYGGGDLPTGVGFYNQDTSPFPGGNGAPFAYAEIMTVAEGGRGGNWSQIGFSTITYEAPRYRQRTSDPSLITNWRDFLVRDLNTTIDVNGFVKIASPIVKLKSDGSSEVNDQAQGVTTERLDVGVYKISGVLGFNSDPSWGGNNGGFSIPQNSNGLPLLWVDYEVDEEGDITLKTYHRTHEGVPSFASNVIEGVVDGEPIDIPEGRWVDLRVEMPTV